MGWDPKHMLRLCYTEKNSTAGMLFTPPPRYAGQPIDSNIACGACLLIGGAGCRLSRAPDKNRCYLVEKVSAPRNS
jgi:hypothetical protein